MASPSNGYLTHGVPPGRARARRRAGRVSRPRWPRAVELCGATGYGEARTSRQWGLGRQDPRQHLREGTHGRSSCSRRRAACRSVCRAVNWSEAGCGACTEKIRFWHPDLPHQRQPDPRPGTLHVLREAWCRSTGAGEITAVRRGTATQKDCSGDACGLLPVGGIRATHPGEGRSSGVHRDPVTGTTPSPNEACYGDGIVNVR